MKTNLSSFFSATLLLPFLSFHKVESNSKSLRSKNIPSQFITSPADYEGNWRLIEAKSDDDMVNLPPNDEIILSIKKTEGTNSYDLEVKAFNTFMSNFDVVGEDENDFDNIDMGLVSTTLMYPPEEFFGIEEFLSTKLSDLNKMKSETDGDDDAGVTLFMKGDNSTLVCEKIPVPMVYEGRWKLIEAYSNDTVVELPSDDDVTIQISKGEGLSEYILGAKAFNHFRSELDIVGRDSNGFDDIEMGIVMNTLAMPPMEFIEVEEFFANELSNMNKMKSYDVGENEKTLKLTMEGDNVKLVCTWFPVPLIYEGKWKLIQAYENNKTVMIPPMEDIILQFVGNPGPSSYKLFAKADNNFKTNLDILTVSHDENGFDAIEVGPVASTRKMPRMKYRDVERFFSTALSTMNEMKSYKVVDDDGENDELIMKSESSSLVCEKYVPKPRSYEGKWKLVKAYDCGKVVTFPDTADIVLQFVGKMNQTSSSYDLNVKAINRFLTSVDIVGMDEKGFDNTEVGPVASTRMAVPEEFGEIETFIATALSDMDKMKPFEDELGTETLMMKSGNTKMICGLIVE